MIGKQTFRPRCLLAAILAASYALRVVLAFSGGQEFWPDEVRYESSRTAAHELVRGHWRAATDQLLGQADHMLFRWVGVPAGLMEEAVGRSPALAASYFGLFSVLAIYLVWAIARRMGAGESEALWAAFLAACASSLFYYSRHFFPYDASLCAMLGALWLAVGPGSPRASFLVGVAAAIGFLTYNGYWLLGGVILVLHALIGDGGLRRMALRGACAAAGLATTLALVVGLGLALGYPLIASFRAYAGNVTQGDFYLGYQVIPEYLWHAEGGLFVLWLAALAYALRGAWRGRAWNRQAWNRLAWPTGGVALLAGGLILFSDVVPKFMVHGRLTRGLVPFLCLGAAAGIERLVRARPRISGRVGAVIGGFAFACAALNFSRPLTQVFPDGFASLAARVIASQPAGSFGFYRMIFVESLWGARLDVPPLYPVLLRRPHPLQFQPYQFEGYSAAQRRAINSHDVSMRLTRLPARLGGGGASWDGYPGPVRLRLIFPADRVHLVEPLVTSGRTGAGDFIFVRYEDEGHVSIGVDHWGVGAQISTPAAVDYRRPHELVIVAGNLMPPDGSAAYRGRSDGARLRGSLRVMLDGVTVLSAPQEFHATRPEEIVFGINLIGGSTVLPGFSGEALSLESASPEAIGAALPPSSSAGRAGWRP